MTDLHDFTIFLHGPSGAGKGEVQRKLTEYYSKRGYAIHYISGGDLFRAATAKPEVAAVMKSGKFFQTLELIKPAFQEHYRTFLQDWISTKGKAILILDGLVRRGEFVGQEGNMIPSQIDQNAEAMFEVKSEFPGLEQADLTQAIDEVKNAKHILIDIDPRDTEAQMKLRANKELIKIKTQLEARIAEDVIPFESTALMLLLLKQLNEVINADVNTEIQFKTYSERIQESRQQISEELHISSGDSFAAFFQNLGITTELRDDDIPPAARRKRIENYVITHESEAGKSYAPGFAAQALIEGLGYQFSADGSFKSTQENGLVIKNGKSRGIELATFQAQCEGMAIRLANQTDEARREMHLGIEGPRRGKES